MSAGCHGASCICHGKPEPASALAARTRVNVVPRYRVVQAHPEDRQFDWYIVNTASWTCVERLSGGFGFASDWVQRLNREAH